jgi:hypothetical protein
VENSALAAILPRALADVRIQPLFIFTLDASKSQVVAPALAWTGASARSLGGRLESEGLKGKILTGGSDAMPASPRCALRRKHLRHADLDARRDSVRGLHPRPIARCPRLPAGRSG